MAHILIVEDDPNMITILKDNLEGEGFTTESCRDGLEGFNKINENIYDLVLLDVMLPHMTGFEICKSLRKSGNEIPIILTTAKGEEIDRVLGLELGADDYITKPFSIRELIARVKAVSRRRGSHTVAKEKEMNKEIKLGKITVNFATYNAFDANGAVPMSHKEFEILKLLYEKKNFTVSRDEILRIIWGFDESPTTRTIDNFIVKLRQKIEENPNRPKNILTVHGIGYKIIG